MLVILIFVNFYLFTLVAHTDGGRRRFPQSVVRGCLLRVMLQPKTSQTACDYTSRVLKGRFAGEEAARGWIKSVDFLCGLL